MAPIPIPTPFRVDAGVPLPRVLLTVGAGPNDAMLGTEGEVRCEARPELELATTEEIKFVHVTTLKLLVNVESTLAAVPVALIVVTGSVASGPPLTILKTDDRARIVVHG